jgi:hypothetical protein
MSALTHSLWSILAISYLAVPAFAQEGFTVVSSQIQGVSVNGPGSPGFAQQLSVLGVDAKVGSAAAAILSRAIVVSNTTNRPVSKFVVRFEYINPAGKMFSENQWQEPREGFEAGGARLITVSKALTEGIRSHWPEETLLQATNGSMSGTIMRSPLIRVSLDAVLFADGDFVGPDVAGAWRMLSEERDFVRTTRLELEQIGGNLEQIHQKLDEIHKPIVDRKLVPGEGIRVTMMREQMFGALTYAASKGYEVFRTALQTRFGESTLTPLTRKF